MINHRNSDKDIEETKRRRTGAFYTPKIWVDKAHEYIESVLGENWKEECLVWDPAAGTANLTRDYDFHDLILSTLEQEDVEVIKQYGYNDGALIMQMDFLNDDIPKEIDEKLKKAASEGKRLVFFMNPPYGTSNNSGIVGKSKTNIASNEICNLMKLNNLGHSTSELCYQFLYRCQNIISYYKFKNYIIGSFTKINIFNSPGHDNLKQYLKNSFNFEKGFIFNAGEFNHTSNSWPIGFIIWKEKFYSNDNILLDVFECSNLQPTLKFTKKINSVNKNLKLNKWVIEHLKINKCVISDLPPVSSGLKVKSDYKYSFNMNDGLLSVFVNNANSVRDNDKLVCLFSTVFSFGAGGDSVIKQNWNRVISTFSARKLTINYWYNHTDQYLIPDISHPDYFQWLSDCHIYTILNGANNCTAMRGINYKDQIWNIKNNFFWKLPEECQPIYNNQHTKEIYKDLQTHKYEPYMAKVLSTLTLSPDAQIVLDKLNKLFIKSLVNREEYDDINEEEIDLHLKSWDAGVYQLKRFWKVRYKDDWDALWRSYKELEDRLREGVYKFGFLK
jgi:hypothetical protein